MEHIAGASIISTADRLGFSIIFAVVTHMILVFGIDFAPTDKSVSHVNTLDVVLVQTNSEKAPDKASYLAQANQEGGGDSPNRERPSAPLPSPIASQAPAEVMAMPLSASRVLDTSLEAGSTPETKPERPTAKPVLTQSLADSEQKVQKTPPPRHKPRTPSQTTAKTSRPSPPATEKINAAALMRRSLALTSLNAEIQQRLRAYAERPRRKWITARTREYKYASYMEAWRTKVEKIGNLNYPEEAARQKMSGSLLLGVALNADGSINEITMHRSSGHKVLDDAAIRIVRLAAPFAPLPPNIREEVDILHIERTWQFLAGNRLASR